MTRASASPGASSNSGNSWSGVGNVPAGDVTGLLLLPDLTFRLLTASGSIYTSTNQDVSFSGLATLNASNFVSLAQVPASPSG
jgi:hypothetical protein